MTVQPTLGEQHPGGRPVASAEQTYAALVTAVVQRAIADTARQVGIEDYRGVSVQPGTAMRRVRGGRT